MTASAAAACWPAEAGWASVPGSAVGRESVPERVLARAPGLARVPAQVPVPERALVQARALVPSPPEAWRTHRRHRRNLSAQRLTTK
jgi:hypothetical protein